MAQITAPHTSTALRSILPVALPVALAVALLLGSVVAGGYLLRDLLDFGVWFLSQP